MQLTTNAKPDIEVLNAQYTSEELVWLITCSVCVFDFIVVCLFDMMYGYPLC